MCNLELSDYRDLLDPENGDEDTLSSLERDGLVRVLPEKVEVTEYGRFALHQMFSDASPHFRCMMVR
jgi:oxygen-independent coproporphyrinogen-3 oxidase